MWCLLVTFFNVTVFNVHNLLFSPIPETLPQGVVSPLVVQCVAYLNREHVLKEEGLFRIPGDLAIIKSYRQKFVAGIVYIIHRDKVIITIIVFC